MRNLCNCPNCQTDNCPAGIDPMHRDRHSFILGMELAMRIARNRAEDCREITRISWAEQAENIAAIIRIVQVEIGSGRIPLPEFSKEEIEEVERIS